MKRAPRKIVPHETYSLSLIFLPIFLHLRRYPPTCMKIGRAAPLQQGDLAHVCAVFSTLFSLGFSCTPLKTAIVLPPGSLPSDIFHARHPLPEHGAAPDARPNATSCCNIRLYDRPRALHSLSANQRPPSFCAAPISANFALFHMKHRLSLCFRHARFCRVFARALSRFYAI